jgi:hypothetical protein
MHVASRPCSKHTAVLGKCFLPAVLGKCFRATGAERAPRFSVCFQRSAMNQSGLHQRATRCAGCLGALALARHRHSR